jgi:hypothetical protein
MKWPLFLLSPSCLRNDFISKMFAQHHEMISLSDNRLLTRELMSEWIEDFCWSQLSKVILPSFATLLFEEQTMRTIKMARNWLISRSKMNTVKVFSELCQKVSPRILVDTTPMLSYQLHNMERIESSFPAARFLHVTSHPVTYGQMVLALYKQYVGSRPGRTFYALVENPESIFFELFDRSDESPLPDPQLTWYKRHKAVASFLSTQQNNQYRTIKIEELMNDTLHTLRNICQWLEIKADNEVLYKMMRSPSSDVFHDCIPIIQYRNISSRFDLFKESIDSIDRWQEEVPWSKSGTKFSDEVINLARSFGY